METEIRQRLASWQLAPTREGAIVEELSLHLDDCYAELVAGGATPAEAYRQTLPELSGSEIAGANCGASSGKATPNPSCWEPIGGQI